MDNLTLIDGGKSKDKDNKALEELIKSLQEFSTDDIALNAIVFVTGEHRDCCLFYNRDGRMMELIGIAHSIPQIIRESLCDE